MFRGVGAVAALVAALLLVSACTGAPHKTKQELLAEGTAQLKAGNPRGALVLLKNALEQDQNFFEARFQLARAYALMGSVDSAEKELRKVLLQSPDLRDARLELARVSLQKSRPDEALRQLAPYMTGAARAAEVLEIAGEAEALKGNYSEAVALLREAVAAEGDAAPARLSLARVYLRRGQTDDAAAQLRSLLDGNPADASALVLLAEVRLREGAPEKALALYDELLKKHPEAVEAHYKRGVLLLEGKRLDEASAAAEQMIRSFPKSARGYELKGMTLYYRKNFNEAIISLQKSLALLPTPGGYYFLGLSHYYRREFEQAMSQMQRALDLNPSFLQARLLLGLILLQQQRVDDAVVEVKRALELKKDNAFAYSILGSAYLTRGEYDAGMEALDRAIALDPALAEAYLKKGMARLSRGRLSEAEADFKAALQKNPAILQTRLMLVSYYLQVRDYGRALAAVKEGLAKSTDRAFSAVLYNYMAAALFGQGKQAEALNALHRAKEANPGYRAPYFTIAAYHLSKRDYETALAEYRALVARDPSDAKALIGMGQTLEAAGRAPEALAAYQQARAAGAPEGFVALARYHVRMKNVDKAVAVLDEAARVVPQSKWPDGLDLVELKGRLYAEAGRYQEALRQFVALEATHPARALPLIVNTQVLLRDYAGALKKLDAALGVDGARVDLMAEAARISLLAGDDAKAAAYAETLLRTAPRSALGYAVRASVYAHLRQDEAAIETLQRGLKLDPGHLPARMMLADLSTRRGDYALAVAAYGEVLKAQPDYVAALFGQAVAYSQAGKKKEAVAAYRRVLDRAADHVPTLNNIAYLYGEGYGSRAEALKLAERASRLAPDNAEVMDTLGYLLLRTGKADEARDLLQKAAALAPNHGTIRYHLALAYHERGDRAKAIEQLEQAVGLGPFQEAREARLLLDSLRKG